MKLKLRRRAKSQSQKNSNSNGRVTAAEMYGVQDSYVRFNQRDHIGSQMFWDSHLESEREKLKVKQRQLSGEGPGLVSRPRRGGWTLQQIPCCR